MSLYADFESPGLLSGLSKCVVILLLLAGVLFSRLPVMFRSRIIFVFVLVSGLAMAVSTFSYAGLRFLDLIAFVLPIVILASHSKANQAFSWKTKGSIFLAGFTSAAAVYRNFLIEAGQGKSPFLPYESISGIF